jgi:hypothetical protein
MCGLPREDILAVANDSIAAIELKPVIGFIDNPFSFYDFRRSQRIEPPPYSKVTLVRVSLDGRIGNGKDEWIVDTMRRDFHGIGRSRESRCAID